MDAEYIMIFAESEPIYIGKITRLSNYIRVKAIVLHTSSIVYSTSSCLSRYSRYPVAVIVIQIYTLIPTDRRTPLDTASV
jgi:hypothetical protein